MLSREVPRGYHDVGRRPGCNGGGRREGGPACSGRATATMARTRKEPPGSRGSPCRITARGCPERDIPSDGAAGAVRGRSERASDGGGASATAAGSVTTSRGSPRRTTVRGRPDCDTPRDGAAGASASTVDAAGTGASATLGAGAGDGAGAGAGPSAGLTRFLWRQRE